MKLFRKYAFAALSALTIAFSASSCSDGITISEQKIGPFLTVCAESYEPYANTSRLIDSLKNELNSIDIKAEKTFGIFYNKYDSENARPHSIVGCIVGSENDSVLIRKLERKQFMVRTIGETNCMTIEGKYENFGSETRKKILQKLSEYSSEKHYKEIPNGENGITEFYSGGKTIYAAEIMQE